MSKMLELQNVIIGFEIFFSSKQEYNKREQARMAIQLFLLESSLKKNENLDWTGARSRIKIKKYISKFKIHTLLVLYAGITWMISSYTHRFHLCFLIIWISVSYHFSCLMSNLFRYKVLNHFCENNTLYYIILMLTILLALF